MSAIRVMQSFRIPRVTTNPYITMLDRALEETISIEHLRFDWRTAIFGRYEVFHWHWPEGKLHGAKWWKTFGKHLLVVAIVLRHRLTGIAVVRTVHNVALPDVNLLSRWVLLAIDRTTDFRIVLNETTPLRSDQPHALILHGDYRSWFSPYTPSPIVSHRIGYFGGIRRYKSVDSLVSAFADAVRSNPSLSLRIGGRPSSDAIADSLTRRMGSVPNAQLELGFLSDDQLVDLVTSSQLIVLAYTFMHNSGSVLAALSLGRPVLVPRNAANQALAEEVGAQWVLMFDGELSSPQLSAAVEASRASADHSGPDLSRRGWSDAGEAHARAYQFALSERRNRRPKAQR